MDKYFIQRVWLQIAVLLMALCITPVAYSADEGKAAKVIELMKISGMYDALKSTHQGNRLHIDQVREMNKQEMKKSFSTIPDSYWEVEQKAYDEMLKDLAPFDYSVDTHVQKWAEFYSEDLTEKEVDEILKYYNSEIGRKDLAASIKAQAMWNNFRKEEYEVALESATKNYIAKLNLFLKEHVEKMQNQQKPRTRKEDTSGTL